MILFGRNLYGQPLPAIVRETIVKVLLGLGWENVPNGECLFVHPKQRLPVSVYVDVISTVGRKQNIAPLWKKSMNLVNLGARTSFF